MDARSCDEIALLNNADAPVPDPPSLERESDVSHDGGDDKDSEGSGSGGEGRGGRGRGGAGAQSGVDPEAVDRISKLLLMIPVDLEELRNIAWGKGGYQVRLRSVGWDDAALCC